MAGPRLRIIQRPEDIDRMKVGEVARLARPLRVVHAKKMGLRRRCGCGAKFLTSQGLKVHRRACSG